MDDLLTFLQTSTALWSLQLVVTAIVFVITTPRSWMRVATLPLLAMYTAHIILTARHDMRKPWASLIGGSSVCWLLHYFDIAILKGYNAADDTWDSKNSRAVATAIKAKRDGAAKKSVPKLNHSYVSRFKRAYLILANLRRIGTAQQVRNIPPFRSANPSYMPPRAALLKRSAVIMMLSYFVMDVLGQTPKQTAEECALAFHSAKIPFFMRIFFPETSTFPINSSLALKAELVQRFAVTAVLWGTAYTMITLVGYAISFTFLLFGCSPSSTRPVFGNASEAYGIRQFWGVFYHQYMRGFLTGIASWLVSFTGLRSGIVKRYAELLIAFAVSGLLHTGGDVGQGMSLGSFSEWTTLRFFVTQAAGIMLEDAIIGAWRRVAGRGVRARFGRPSLWKRVLGYVWLAVFMTWSTPRWAYPHARWAGPSEAPLLPVSVIKWAVSLKVGDLNSMQASPGAPIGAGEF